MARILVVEDSPTNRLLTRELLIAHGHEVIEAEAGMPGLAAARTERPELILLDLQLPDIDGFTVVRAIRDDASIAAIPVLAVTAFTHDGVRQQALESGCDGFVPKPIRYRTLLEAMDSALAARASA